MYDSFFYLSDLKFSGDRRVSCARRLCTRMHCLTASAYPITGTLMTVLVDATWGLQDVGYPKGSGAPHGPRRWVIDQAPGLLQG